MDAGTTTGTTGSGTNTAPAVTESPSKSALVLLGDHNKILGTGEGLSRQYHFLCGVPQDVEGRDRAVLERTGLFAKVGTAEADEAMIAAGLMAVPAE